MKDVTFDPETLDLLRAVLDDAWDALPSDRRKTTTQSAGGAHSQTRGFRRARSSPPEGSRAG